MGRIWCQINLEYCKCSVTDYNQGNNEHGEEESKIRKCYPKSLSCGLLIRNVCVLWTKTQCTCSVFC